MYFCLYKKTIHKSFQKLLYFSAFREMRLLQSVEFGKFNLFLHELEFVTYLIFIFKINSKVRLEVNIYYSKLKCQDNANLSSNKKNIVKS